MTVSRALMLLLAPAAAAQQAPSPFFPVPPAASSELRFSSQLPKFQAQDIGGRTWKLEDLQGRFTLIYIWSTSEARVWDALPSQARFMDPLAPSRVAALLREGKGRQRHPGAHNLQRLRKR